MSDPREDGLDTVADCVDALTNPMEVRERYDIWDRNRNLKTYWWKHRMPSLLRQLQRAAIPGEVYVEETGGGIRRMPASCPPARLDAINLGLAITAWAANTVWFDCHIPTRDDTAANLRALVGAQVDSDTSQATLTQLRRYVYQARTVAGWERPPWRPDAPCPACDKHGLRVRLDKGIAACTECGEGWDQNTIGILAAHVSAATAAKLDSAPR